MSESSATIESRIRGLRPRKPAVDAWRAHGTAIDVERRPNGAIERALTVFLAGAECPFTCAFCDLWRYTIDGPTPRGALPHQLADVLASHNASDDTAGIQRLKLYNASNFFDSRAVPVDDWADIAGLAKPFAAVTVESHATTIGPKVLDFANMLDGRLEVAIGLETIHPEAIQRSNKRLELDRFERAAAFLAEHDIDLRVFVLLGAPFVPREESVEWTVRTVQYAARLGAAVVAIIPVRGGNGELERLEHEGHFTPPTLPQLESALDACLSQAPAVITADLWDADRFSTCEQCVDDRIARLGRINCTGQPESPVVCARCTA